MPVSILSVVESRSGLLKVAALCEAIKVSSGLSARTVMRHSLLELQPAADEAPPTALFNDIELPKPDAILRVPAPGAAAEKIALCSKQISDIVTGAAPDIVIITGNSDQSLTCALIGKGMPFPPRGNGAAGGAAVALMNPERVDDIEAPARRMNLTLLDFLADYVFVSEASAAGEFAPRIASPRKIYAVGSLDAGNLVRCWRAAMGSSILVDLQLTGAGRVKAFALVTLGRTSGPGAVAQLQLLQPALSAVARRMPVVCPAGAEVLRCIEAAGMEDYFVDHFINRAEGQDGRVRIRLVPPLGYLDLVKLVASASLILTDGELRMEASVLGVPCMMLARDTDLAEIDSFVRKARRGEAGKRDVHSSGLSADGRAAERIVQILLQDFAFETSARRLGPLLVNVSANEAV
jgi:UDP-N-acetylglucosamine 2-epimerase (non-hydrolysing)